MSPNERTNLAMAAVELRAGVDHFNHAADDLAAAGRLLAGSEVSRAVARCASLAAELDAEVARALQAVAA